MDKVGNDKDTVFLEHCVSGSVTVGGNGLHSAFESVARLEEMQSVFICLKHCLCQFGIVAVHSLPCFGFHAIDI